MHGRDLLEHLRDRLADRVFEFAAPKCFSAIAALFPEDSAGLTGTHHDRPDAFSAAAQSRDRRAGVRFHRRSDG